jgi:hypothetical protein
VVAASTWGGKTEVFLTDPADYRDEANRAWIDKIIANRGLVYMVSEPTEAALWQESKVGSVLTGFGREYYGLVGGYGFKGGDYYRAGNYLLPSPK